MTECVKTQFNANSHFLTTLGWYQPYTILIVDATKDETDGSISQSEILQYEILIIEDPIGSY